jgi:hypothetical protein
MQKLTDTEQYRTMEEFVEARAMALQLQLQCSNIFPLYFICFGSFF